MQQARDECPSATLRRTLKRRRSSTYEASGLFSVTSASSAFSVPAVAISSSCKPTALLCSDASQHCSLYSDGCVATAAHSVCRGNCDQFTVSGRAADASRRDSLMGPGHTDKSVSECTCARARLRACGNCLVLERARQVAACDMRQDGRHLCTTCNMQHATCSVRAPAIPWQRVADDAIYAVQRVAAR
jgi:hypothetical protein